MKSINEVESKQQIITSEEDAIEALTVDGRMGIWRKRETLNIDPHLLTKMKRRGIVEKRKINKSICFRYKPVQLKIKDDTAENYLKQLIA